MKFLIAGDFCVRNYAEEQLTEEFINKVANGAKELVEKHDLAMYGNETVYTYTGKPIVKSGPPLVSLHKSLDIIKKMGYDIAACANNHIGDQGTEGVLETIDFLKKSGLEVVGAGENLSDAVKPLYVEKCGIKLAIINCAEHEFGFAEKNKPGGAPMDFYDTGHLVMDAKENADKVVVYIHGGNEFNPVPRPGMIKFCKHLAECGADAVIVAHSHCPQGMEIHNDVPIYYGLGNFYFQTPSNENMWQYGYTVSLNIEKDAPITVEINPHKQLPEGLFIMEGEDKEYFMEYFDQLCKLFKDEEMYEGITNAWGVDYDRISSRWFEDRTMTDPQGEYALFIRNSYTCESHAELMARYHKNRCEGNFNEETEKYIEIIQKLKNYEIL